MAWPRAKDRQRPSATGTQRGGWRLLQAGQRGRSDHFPTFMFSYFHGLQFSNTTFFNCPAQVAYMEGPGLTRDPQEEEGGSHRPGAAGLCWERQWEQAIAYMRQRWGQHNRWDPGSYYWFGSNVSGAAGAGHEDSQGR